MMGGLTVNFVLVITIEHFNEIDISMVHQLNCSGLK